MWLLAPYLTRLQLSHCITPVPVTSISVSLLLILTLQVQLESCKQELTEKAGLVAEASLALENMEKQLQVQEVRHKDQLRQMEDTMTEVDLLPRFDLGSVPGRKSIRSPDVTRKQPLSLSSPKFGHKINFFQPDRDDSTNNNNKETLSDRLVLEVLEEDEEISDMERKCEGHLKKIQELEILVARGQTNLQQVIAEI